MNWFKRLFKKEGDDRYRPRVRTLFDFLTMYSEAYHEHRVMHGFIHQISRDNCEDLIRLPSKNLLRRYSVRIENCNGLAWWLLEKYSEGKITIKE